MNYLELVRELARESGTTDTADPAGTGILTLENPPVKHLEDLIAWTRKAWLDIQLQCDWSFLVREGQITTTPGEKTIDILAQVPDFRRLEPYFEPFRMRWIRLENRDKLAAVRYSQWTGQTALKISRQSKPRNFTIRPDGLMELWPVPQAEYTITFDYLREPQILAEDEDVPILPLRYHDVIVYRALLKYAGFDEAQAQYQRAMPEFRKLMHDMGRELLPEIRVRGAR